MQDRNPGRHARSPSGIHVGVARLRVHRRIARVLGRRAHVRDDTDRVSSRMRRRLFAIGAVMAVTAVAVPTIAAEALTVHRSNTLSVIASRHGTTVSCLALANHITNPNLIYVGQHLRLNTCMGHRHRTGMRTVGFRTRQPSRSFDRTCSDPKGYARLLAGSQFPAVDAIFTRESGWRTFAYNPSGAYGIPQALPGSKMASAGPDWRTNPCTQIRWGIGYMRARYGSPWGAWAFWQGHSFY